MSGYVLSRRAQADLREIWNYTADRWGIEQAERYVRQIHETMKTVAAAPEKGRPCDNLRAGYRRIPAQSHMVSFAFAEIKSSSYGFCINAWISSATCGE